MSLADIPFFLTFSLSSLFFRQSNNPSFLLIAEVICMHQYIQYFVRKIISREFTGEPFGLQTFVIIHKLQVIQFLHNICNLQQ